MFVSVCEQCQQVQHGGEEGHDDEEAEADHSQQRGGCGR